MFLRAAFAAVFLASAAQTECRLALALGLDVSGSVDAREYQLQLNGLAAALTAPEVQDQILSLPEQPVWITVFEWAGEDYQRPMIDWRALRGPDDIARVATSLRVQLREPGTTSTAIGSAMEFSSQLFAQRPGCAAYTLDLSGDGINNSGPLPTSVRTTPPFRGVTINGLIIGSDVTRGRDERLMEMMELSAYYRRRVIHGFGAFVEIAEGFEDYERAMTRKLLRETAQIQIGGLMDGEIRQP